MKRRYKHLDFFDESARTILDYYYYYFDRLKELAISRFEYENMPLSVDTRYLELKVFENTKALFFKDDILGYLTLAYADGGRLDIYGNSIKRRAYADNGYHINRDNTNSVIIYDNYLHKSTYNAMHIFAKKLALLDHVININVNAQKTPILITASQNDRLSMLNLYKEYSGGAPVIFGDKNLNPDCLKVLNTQAPYVARDLYELKINTWNEALTYLGISNVSIQKRERMVSDEVTKNLGGTIASRNSALNSRQYAVEQINKMFDLDIKVSFNDFDSSNVEMPNGEEVEENE